MKKLIILVLVAVVALTTVGVVSASPGGTPPNPPGSNGQGDKPGKPPKDKKGMMGRGSILGHANPNGGALQESLFASFAAELGMTGEEFQAALAENKSILGVLPAQGLTGEAARAMIDTAYQNALTTAVAAGTITQPEADWLQQKHDLAWACGALPGFGEVDPTDCKAVGETDPEAGDEDTVDGEASTTAWTGSGHGYPKHLRLWKQKQD